MAIARNRLVSVCALKIGFFFAGVWQPKIKKKKKKKKKKKRNLRIGIVKCLYLCFLV
jgi:hypothetical protein